VVVDVSSAPDPATGIVSVLPNRRIRFAPAPGFDGPGPNVLLQNHILMAFHPPMLYLGFVGFTVPFAFAIAALATGRLGEGWLIETRRATLVAWGFLTVGIVLGAWWSYEVLGWGGFWAWDPVENASFLPWLTATAFIHSVIVQERRGMLRVWNLSLVIATFCESCAPSATITMLFRRPAARPVLSSLQSRSSQPGSGGFSGMKT
jgi:cytochrome c biogenesis factor